LRLGKGRHRWSHEWRGNRVSKTWSRVVECFIGCLSVFNTIKGGIKLGFVESFWVARAYLYKEPARDFRVACHRVGLGRLAEHSSLGKVLLEDREADSW
jgi:hypothetical protein